MRQDIKRIKASAVRVGDVIAFHNPRMDYEVESIEPTKIGSIRFHHGNGTASDCVLPSDHVFIRLVDGCQSAAVETLPAGEYVKRKADSSKVYIRGAYDRSSKTYSLIDCSDINREIFVKRGTPLFFGFTY